MSLNQSVAGATLLSVQYVRVLELLICCIVTITRPMYLDLAEPLIKNYGSLIIFLVF